MGIRWPTAAQIEKAADSNTLFESANLDGKKGLPGSDVNGNAEVAKDVTAMTVNGGALIYGIGEDANKQLTVLAAFPLADVKERIDNIVKTGVDPRPTIKVHELPLDDGSGNGYVVVEIPMSPLAPHMHVATGHFYGRSATGNVILSQPEIKALYERQTDYETDAAEVLEEVIASAPYEPLEELGFLHVFVRPVVRDADRWSKLEDQELLFGVLMREVLHDGRSGQVWASGTGYGHNWRDSGVDSKLVSTAWPELDVSDDGELEHAQQIEVHRDGKVTGLMAGAIWTITGPGDPHGFKQLRESQIADHVADTFGVAGRLLDAAGYSGPVQLGVCVTGIEQVYSADLMGRGGRVGLRYLDRGTDFTSPDYKRVATVNVDAILEPQAVARDLLNDLFSKTAGGPDFDPFR